MYNNEMCYGDCLNIMQSIRDNSIDLIYMDPPFYTQTTQRLADKNGREYSFEDSWDSIDSYIEYIEKRLIECHRVLKNTGSIFVHCDRNASHYLRILMDKVFGEGNFQSEIIWCYKRWSNSKKGLLNNHQTILFYSKTHSYKFNQIYTDYSETTNVDQILQERERDINGKSKYKTDDNGIVIMGQAKKGVPLSDVWEIPFLNPKAKERVGYPTQKPIILLEQIISLTTDENDIVLDPFAGSGTTLVAAKMLNRKYIGIDISEEAVSLSKDRLKQMIKTESILLKKGKKAYNNLDEKCLNIVKSLDAIPVQRNRGIDGFMKEHINGGAVSIRIQRENEAIHETVEKIVNASRNKNCSFMVVIRTNGDRFEKTNYLELPQNVLIIDQYDLQIEKAVENILCLNSPAAVAK